ncbi:MAG TPA: PAS domain S-box protein, partial [Gammaproteobacteria bacterium]|nr:PAS domain S-box protein [Gammaproteobacteria bacterium]
MFNAQQNDFTFDWIKYVVVAAGGLTLLLGGIVLIGWYTQSTFLVQVRPEFVPMQYNTALAFIFCGTALIALVYRYSRLVLLCGGLSIGLSLLTLLQYILGLNLGIDQLFMESIIVVKTVYPGRMAQITAFSHLIYGIGLVIACGVVGSKWHDVLNGLLGTIVAAIGMGTLFGYLLGAETPYGWSYLTYMAVHTAFGFVLLGLGLFIFAIHKGLREGRRPTWISVAVGIGVAT